MDIYCKIFLEKISNLSRWIFSTNSDNQVEKYMKTLIKGKKALITDIDAGI